MPPSREARNGFALLITLTLLAFVVILLVGLSAYTRIETAVAGNTQRQAQARQNALLALNAAVAHLQRYAGPDQRVTATAEAFPNASGTRYYTGVWDATGTGPTPLTWLVSGNEVLKPDGTGDPLAVTPAAVAGSTVELVGKNTSGTASDVVAPLVAIKSYGVPGQFANDNATTGGTTLGRYAWWVGDQGVKAAVALADRTAAVNYAPWDSAELNSRIRQQIGLGAGPADAAGNAVFEPRDTTTGNPTNAALTANTTDFGQLAFFNKVSGGTVGLATLQQNYHAWSPNNFAVLANTKLGGLRQDLSLKPDLLGSAFAAWADYKSYMEDPVAPATPAPLPAYGSDPLRRRYKITPSVFSPTVGVSPVLNYFYLLFGVRKQTGAQPYTLSLRWAAALWNPYTSALVPEDLCLDIFGLPASVTTTVVNTGTGATADDITFNLRQLYGEPLKVTLPWTPSSSPKPAEESWLPGRVYNWTYLPGATLQLGADNPGRFNSRDFGAFGDGLTVTIPASNTVNGNSQLAIRIPVPTTLRLVLKRANGDVLATYTSPAFDAVPLSDHGAANGTTSQCGFDFRLAESVDTVATNPNEWLTTPGRDPRSDQLPPDSFTVPNTTSPVDYSSGNFNLRIRAPERLLDRDITNGLSYNEDVPIFELPRAPILSLGELQHFYVAGARPFSVGNSWGDGIQVGGMNVGTLPDRFFFSGLVAGITPIAANGSIVMPNSLLTPLPRNGATGATVTVADLQGAPNQQSSKFLLQSGAFNFNSATPSAWEAVLRSGRFMSAANFTYLNSDPASGTASDDLVTLTPDQTVLANLPTAAFFRFAQSAQETYKADDGYVQSTSGPEQNTLDTPLFRRGMRALSPGDISSLATKLADAIRLYQNASGPLRSVEEFLARGSVGAPSLIEQAISDAGINANIAEFSSQWLTQADIMTALAPVLFPRSDTFVVRAYGEEVNPATGATEGKAWCEATIQRVPAYFDPSDPEETALASLNATNQAVGRRFKIVSFRWLTHSDI